MGPCDTACQKSSVTISSSVCDAQRCTVGRNRSIEVEQTHSPPRHELAINTQLQSLLLRVGAPARAAECIIKTYHFSP
ncbi:hypothetical protein EYF80_020454 [Liparis tanakae]|uniref:Uncharacterized protein n=1 Tax=Liparis tanakae TaxID=230148 RepID=A0A4Z2HWE9_9TELE|nr:hypothetical protein EYF80_020454 [Liparis tanakae]